MKSNAGDDQPHGPPEERSGTLRYDSDGSGKAKAHVIAVFDDAPALKAGDILVI
jgi:hypothetical protein